MPKLSYRCSRRSGYLPSVATVAFCAPPRKVSFEDGHSDSDSSLSAAGSSSPAHRASDPSPLRPKATMLRRPKSSLSLVELAKSGDENDDDDNNHNTLQFQQQDENENESMLISPVSRSLDMQVSPPLTPSSPWGYFVDMVMPDSGTTTTEGTATTCSSSSAPTPPHLVYHEGPCSCCSSCRRRRASPYGDYKKQRRSSLCFHGNNNSNYSNSNIHNPGNRRSIPLPLSIRLAPRRQLQTPPPTPKQEPADQLAGAMTHLHVMDS